MLIAVNACSDDDDPFVYGEVGPAFSEAPTAYRSWDGSYAPGDGARDRAIASGVRLLKVDAMACAHSRQAGEAALDADARK